jgi:hypothetical protein
MDFASLFTGTPAVQGAVQPGMTPLPSATTGLFGSAGQFGSGYLNSGAFQMLGSGISTALGAYGNIQAGQMMKAQYDMQAGSYKTQAELVKVNAKEQANTLRKKLLEDLGSANASAAARGIDTGSGTPLQIIQESIGNVGRDIQRLEAGANIQAGSSNTSASRSAAAGATAAQAGYYRGAQSIANYVLK